MMSIIQMSTRRFVEHIKMGYEANQRYCFILGAGASFTSGIPTGEKLMVEWRDYLRSKGHTYIEECARECGMNPDEWEPIFTEDYQFKNNDYFTLFDLRFAGMPFVAYSYLKKLMEDAEPSIGYYMLALLMANTDNKLVITTNFDTLLEDVLRQCNVKRPLVAGHESLAPYISRMENMGRPVVAKVHRDLYFHPLNHAQEMKKLSETWEESLRAELSYYTPIVIGYAGGDQTLMDMLERMRLKTIYWCDLKEPALRITEFLKRSPRGYLVHIEGFDEIMFALQLELTKDKAFDSPVKIMREQYERWQKNYKAQYELMSSKIVKKKALEPSNEAVGLTQNDAEYRNSRGKKFFEMGRYEEALADENEAVRLEPGNAKYRDPRYAPLHNIGRYEEALADKNEAVRLAPNNAIYRVSRGVILHEMERYDEALADFNEAIRLAPYDVICYTFRGIAFHKLELYEKALADENEAVRLAPNNPQCYTYRSETLEKLGRKKEARADRETARRLREGKN